MKKIMLTLSFLLCFCPTLSALEGDQILDNLPPEGGGTLIVDSIESVDSIDADTETTLKNALELQDLQGAVTDAQVPDDITITELDPLALKIADFTGDGGFLVGTGSGTYQEESGNTARTSLGLGTGDTPTFYGLTVAGHVGIGDATPSSDIMLNIEDLAINTEDAFYGLAVDITKTAGATGDIGDTLIGVISQTDFDQVSGTLGGIRAANYSANLTNGTVDTIVHGLFSNAVVFSGGTLSGTYGLGDLIGGHLSANAQAGSTIYGDVVGLRLAVYGNSNPSNGYVAAMEWTEYGSYVDYGIYQMGSAPNYFGGTVDAEYYKAREQSSDPADPAEGEHVMWQSDGTGSGDDGDIMIKITAGGSTKTITLIDFSTY